MKISLNLNIKKEHFYFLVVLIAVLFAVGVNASVYKNINNKVGHDANETGPGIFGGTSTSWFIFPGNLRINNSLNVSGNITFENKAQITATTLLLNTSNVTIQANLTLGGISKDSWPSGGVATSRLPAENISSGTFGANTGADLNSLFTFPGNLKTTNNTETDSLKVNKNITIEGNIKFANKAQITAPNLTINTPNLTITNNLTLGGISRDSWPGDTKNLSARNITSGTFGENVGNGNFTFPENLNVTKNMAIGGNITFTNKATITAPNNLTIDTPNLNITRNITIGNISRDSWPTTVIAVHSQNSTIPNCPTGWNSLWTGYSLVETSIANPLAQSADLGKSGSCVPYFRFMPILECNEAHTCSIGTVGDFSYWLVDADNPPSYGSRLTGNVATEISRCKVCEKPAAILVNHSQSTTTPTCPTGWTELWHGYSYLITTGNGAGTDWNRGWNAAQELSSPGSCLQKFKQIPFIECDVGSSCTYVSGGDFAGWLASEDGPGGAWNTAQSISHVSRCVVCSK